MTREQILGSAPATELAGSINSAVTSFSITSGTGWPTGSPGPFVATIDRGLATEEKVLITSRSGTSLTGVTRGYDGSTAQAHANLAEIEHTISAVMLDEVNRVANEQQGNVGYAAGTTVARTSKVTGDGNPRFVVDANGKMTWGPGSAGVDVQLQRLAADMLELQDEMRFLRASAASQTQSTRVSGDATDRHNVLADGKHQWGAGAGAVDTNLYRASADKLKTDDAMEVGAAFTALSTAAVTGVLTASNFKRGSGSPESAVTGAVGDVYERTDGGAGSTFYVKESGAGNTGWVPLSTPRNKTLAKSYADVATTTTPGDVDLITQAVAAGDIAAGEMLRFTVWGIINATSVFFDMYLKLDATKVAASANLYATGAGALAKWQMEFLVAFPTISTQRIRGTGWAVGTATLGANDIDTAGQLIGVDGTGAIDFTAGKNVTFGVKQSGAGTITAQGWLLQRVSG